MSKEQDFIKEGLDTLLSGKVPQELILVYQEALVAATCFGNFAIGEMFNNVAYQLERVLLFYNVNVIDYKQKLLSLSAEYQKIVAEGTTKLTETLAKL